MCLSGCTTTNYKTTAVVLPEMPLAGREVSKELELYCKDYKSCPHTLEWLNKLYWFRVEYTTYQKELQK